MTTQALRIPGDYVAGYEKARKIDPALANNYIAHAYVGDPVADELVEALSGLPRAEGYRHIETGMNQGAAALGDAPRAVQAFFEAVEQPPDWFHQHDFSPGILSFHRESDLILQALVGGSLIEGFSSNIARSFDITGRLRSQGVRRLLGRSGEWDPEAWGVPLSAAHMGLASAAFSGRLLRHAVRLGVPFSQEERESFMHVWRYSMHLMGVPSTILWRDEEEALRLFEIGSTCEPPPGIDSIVMAHELIEAIPFVLGIEDERERKSLVRLAFSLSRALIGREKANQLKLPKYRTWGLLEGVRLRTRLDLVENAIFKRHRQSTRLSHFKYLMKASVYDREGISFRLPDHVHSEESHRW